jgi:hypothetical protein
MGETRTVTPSDRLTPDDPASRGTEVGPVPGRPAPPPVDVALLWVAVVAVSTSGPLIRGADAPSLAIAFYRNALALPVVFAAVLLVRGRRRELRSLGPRERRLAALAGLFLAAHFATWVPSLALARGLPPAHPRHRGSTQTHRPGAWGRAQTSAAHRARAESSEGSDSPWFRS